VFWWWWWCAWLNRPTFSGAVERVVKISRCLNAYITLRVTRWPNACLKQAQHHFEMSSEVISDNSSILHPTWLVSIAARPRRHHPCLSLDSSCSVTFLLSVLVTNHDLLTIRLCCQLYTAVFRESAPSEPKQPPQKKNSFTLKADSSHNMA
jgi:hypothetical protein